MCTLNIVYRIFEYAAIPVVLFRAFHSFRDDVHCSEQFVQGIVVLFFFSSSSRLAVCTTNKIKENGEQKKKYEKRAKQFWVGVV